jgi:hypothetical protein
MKHRSCSPSFNSKISFTFQQVTDKNSKKMGYKLFWVDLSGAEVETTFISVELTASVMAKQIDYPRASLKNSLELAKAVDDLGGSCSIEMAADKLNKKVSGAFTALVGSSVRFDLITSKKGQLETSPLYRDYKLAYSKDEANKVLATAFLKPPLFHRIFERFQDRELPLTHFEKLLIREFDVPDAISSRVSKYFLDGAKQCGILGANHVLSSSISENSALDAEEDTEIADDGLVPLRQEQTKAQRKTIEQDQEVISHDADYSVRIKGPGMDSVIVIHEEEDLLIVQAMLKKVHKKIALFEDRDWSDDED